MQDMRDLYKAYAAVHDTTIKEELDNSKDQITEMNLSQLTGGDLVEVCEEIVEGLFQYGLDLDGAYGVVGDILEAASDNIIGDRKNKIVSIAEAFEKVFETVTDKAERNCEEAFLNYRKTKPLTEKWNNRVSHEVGNSKIHAAIIHEDREGVKAGLIEMISEKLDKVGQEDADVDNDGDVDSSDSYLKKRRAAIGKAMGKKMKKEEYVTELSKKTLGSYVKKAAGDAASRSFDHGESEKRQYEPDADDEKETNKLANRQKGIGRAVNKMMKKEETQVAELYKGKHGQSEKEYQDSRSDGGKMVSGDSKMSGSKYAQGRRTGSDAGPQSAGGSKKPESQGKMDSGTRTDLEFRKTALKKKEAEKKEKNEGYLFSDSEAERLNDLAETLGLGEALKGPDGKPLPISAKARNDAAYAVKAAKFKRENPGVTDYTAYKAGGGDKGSPINLRTQTSDRARRQRELIQKSGQEKINKSRAMQRDNRTSQVGPPAPKPDNRTTTQKVDSLVDTFAKNDPSNKTTQALIKNRQNRPTSSPTSSTSSTSKPASVAKTSTPAPAPKRDRMANASKSDRMAAFAKANPKLAARQAERDRTRGTSATTNPLMRDMKSRMPAPKPATPVAKPMGSKAVGSTAKPMASKPVASAAKPMGNKPVATSNSSAMSKPTPTPVAKPSMNSSKLGKALSGVKKVGEELQWSQEEIDRINSITETWED